MLQPQKLLNRFTLLALLLLGVILTSCAKTETHVTLYADERWEGEIIIELPPETVALVGGPQSLEQRLEQELGGLQDDENMAMDLDQELRNDGSFVINGQASGQGFDELNQTFFDRQANILAEEVNGQRQITIQRNYASLEVGSNTVTITGGEIIDSNADEIDGGTAIWNNPTRIEVTLTESSSAFAWWVWGLGILGVGAVCLGIVGLAGLGGFLWYRRNQPATT